VVFNQDSFSFKKSLVVFNQDSSSLKKSLVVFKIIQILKDCLINWILMNFFFFYDFTLSLPPFSLPPLSLIASSFLSLSLSLSRSLFSLSLSLSLKKIK